MIPSLEALATVVQINYQSGIGSLILPFALANSTSETANSCEQQLRRPYQTASAYGRSAPSNPIAGDSQSPSDSAGSAAGSAGTRRN